MNLKNRILLFSHDAGGANEVMAYGYLMNKKGHCVMAFPKGPAVDIFKQHIPNLISNQQLDFKKTDIIITGTSGIHSNYELEITKYAKEKNLKVISLLDSTDKLKVRFSLDGKELIKDKYLPDQIIYSQKSFNIKEAKSLAKRFFYHKSYYLHYLKNIYYKNNIKITHPLIQKYKNSYILLVTEYLRDLFGDKYGFDEFDVCTHIFNEVLNINKNIPILLKTHPAENPKKYDNVIKQYPLLNIYTDNFIIQEAIKYSYCVFGLNSSVFKESTLINKPTYSIQIGAIKTMNTVLKKEQIINTNTQLQNILKKWH